MYHDVGNQHLLDGFVKVYVKSEICAGALYEKGLLSLAGNNVGTLPDVVPWQFLRKSKTHLKFIHFHINVSVQLT